MKRFLLVICLFPCLVFAQTDVKYDPSEDSLKIGQQFPSFNLQSLNGYNVHSDSIKKIMVISFYSTSCFACNEQIPQLNKLAQSFKNKGVVFLSICPEDRQLVKSYLQRHPFKYEPLLIDDDLLSYYFQVDNFPTNVIVNWNKQVVYYRTGDPSSLSELDEVFGEMKKKLTELTTEKD